MDHCRVPPAASEMATALLLPNSAWPGKTLKLQLQEIEYTVLGNGVRHPTHNDITAEEECRKVLCQSWLSKEDHQKHDKFVVHAIWDKSPNAQYAVREHWQVPHQPSP